MPDLTADTCPTCGLPAEVLERNDTEAIARCILLHDFIAVESARKSWRPLAPKARASQSPLTGTDKGEGREAA